jgi:hypothetical protein
VEFHLLTGPGLVRQAAFVVFSVVSDFLNGC